jgi:Tripartite tricarboxylate transporter TctB family
MLNQNLVRGVFLAAVALAFGLGALRYPLGDFAHAGAGLFPLLVSSLLLVVAILTIVQSRLIAAVPLELNLKNIALVLAGLVGFVVFSLIINMVVGIVALVFIASLAGSSYSWKRNLQVSAGLIAVAVAFQKLLGLNLKLWFI